MLSVRQAIEKILAGANPLGTESVPLTELNGRISATEICARITQPPFAASAMDGYAIRFEDLEPSVPLEIIGEAPAGAPYTGHVEPGQAIRIFTGGAIPAGADHVVIQEDVTRSGNKIIVDQEQLRPRNIRAAGIDFKKGDVLVPAGERLHEMHGSILAAANVPEIIVTRRPRVALFSNGDELVEPGQALAPGQIVNSNHYALSAMIRSWGGEVTYLGCAADTQEALQQYFKTAQDADIIVPIGGASVGDYDFVKSAFTNLGGSTEFEKVAVRPGKPTWYGKLDKAQVIGLPGNPASAIVTCAIFVQALVRSLAGGSDHSLTTTAKTRSSLPANGSRETYLRARVVFDEADGLLADPIANQDSSLLSPFAKANALIRRDVDAGEVLPEGLVDVIWLRRPV